MGKDKSAAYRTGNTTETLALARTHPPKTTPNHHKGSTQLEPTGQKQKGPSWRRDLEADVWRLGYIWREVERLAQDRPGWRNIVGGLCRKRDFYVRPAISAPATVSAGQICMNV